MHVLVAEELANWLKLRPFAGCPKQLECTGEEFKEKYNNKKGIVFFKDYWQRAGEQGTQRTGDHIDLWKDGVLAGQSWVMSFARITLGVHWDGIISDYELSNKVVLWEIA